MWTRNLARARANQFRSLLRLEELAPRNSPSSLLNTSHDALDSDLSLDPGTATKSTVIAVNRDTTTDPTKRHPADSGSSSTPKEPVTATKQAGQTSQGPTSNTTTPQTETPLVPVAATKVAASTPAKSDGKTSAKAVTSEKSESTHVTLTHSTGKTEGKTESKAHTASMDLSIGTSSVSAPAGIQITDFVATEGGNGLWTFEGTVSAQTLEGNTVTLGGLPDIKGLTMTTNGDGEFGEAVQLKTDGTDDGTADAIAATPQGQQSEYAYCQVTAS